MVTTFLATNEQIALLIQHYNTYKQASANPYMCFLARLPHCSISVYTSNKVVFQGSDAEKEASKWTNIQAAAFTPHAGSDEVGTGDYFGPVCVCACFVSSENYAKVQDLHINDSKVIQDAMILKTAPKLMSMLAYSLLILPNRKYNEIQQTNNLNAIKAKLHNQAYLHLAKKINLHGQPAIVDQFTPKTNYFRYLEQETQLYRELTFETKAESKYHAVACASMIARYAFLKEMENMEQLWHQPFPKGAGDRVILAARQFVAANGQEELQNVAKLHFETTKKVLI